jgi:hypothetical protein
MVDCFVKLEMVVLGGEWFGDMLMYAVESLPTRNHQDAL